MNTITRRHGMAAGAAIMAAGATVSGPIVGGLLVLHAAVAAWLAWVD
jgi:hypothetical protein